MRLVTQAEASTKAPGTPTAIIGGRNAHKPAAPTAHATPNAPTTW
jgi:hypothetical protein